MQTDLEKNIQLALNLKLQNPNLTYPQIAEKIGRPVGTIKRWLAPYKDQWQKQSDENKVKNALNGSLINKAKKENLRKQAYDEAYKNAPEDLKDELLRDFVNLYIGEGTKKARKITMTNSDLRTILLSLTVMKKYFLKDDKKIRIEIRYYQHNDNEQELLSYWKNILSNESSVEYRTYRQSRKNEGSYNDSNKFGLIILDLCDVYAKERLNAYMDFLKEKWLSEFEITFNKKIDQSIKEVKSLKKA